MSYSSFVKNNLGIGLIVAVLGIAFLVIGVPQAQSQNGPSDEVNLRFDVVNLACGIENGSFDVFAVSSTDGCVSNDVNGGGLVIVGSNCSEGLQIILSLGYGIEPGGSSAVGIKEALVTTAAGVTYTLIRQNLSRRTRGCPTVVD